MGSLEEELEKIHEAKIGVSITWLWDGGVDVRVVGRSGALIAETNVETVAEILPWLEAVIARDCPTARYRRGYQAAVGKLQIELQKIYDSEINIEISWLPAGAVHVKLGNEFYGFDEEATVVLIADTLPWLQRAIHDRYSGSRYDVERRGEKWEPKWFGPGKPGGGMFQDGR
jgi:hypothetical protein